MTIINKGQAQDLPLQVTSDNTVVGVPLAGTLKTVCEIVGEFKSISTNKYINGVKQSAWTPFEGKLWQRNYYDHIIRNEKELEKTREYISNNALKWDEDDENPDKNKPRRFLTHSSNLH